MSNKTAEKKTANADTTTATARRQEKRRRARINTRLEVTLLAVSCAVVAALIFNLVRIARTGVFASGTDTTLTLDTENSMSNDEYTIGNNPTDLEKEYFQELTDAMETGDSLAISEALCKEFAADYLTWRNKDGTYEVGGLQYIYGPQYVAFNNYSRWNYMNDFDLYLSQYGRDHLPQVASVEVTDSYDNGSFEVKLEDPRRTLDSYYVAVTITYEADSVLDPSRFVDHGTFVVVNNDGRYEIAEIYLFQPGVEE